MSTGKRLSEDQIIFLFALREVENGSQGNEFGIKCVKSTNFEKQALCAIDSVLKNDCRWQTHIRDYGFIPFYKFFGMFGGPAGLGWHYNCSDWLIKMDKAIKEIENEFKGNKRMGREHRGCELESD